MAFTFVNQPVSVHLLIDPDQKDDALRLVRVKWQGKVYVVQGTGKYHTDRRGITKIHLFTVNVGMLDMRLEIDGSSLDAVLIATSDGLAD